MITGLRGAVLLELPDATFLADALDHDFQALQSCGIQPSARLADFHQRLAKAVASASQPTGNTLAHASKVDTQQDSGHIALYDLVDTNGAAAIIGCTDSNVRDLGRRGRIPRHRAGRGWVYPAASVVSYAESRAAKRS